MKVKVNQDVCVGSQDCVDTCPEVFKMEGEKAAVQLEEVPKELEDKCKSAADACPAAAITIE
ncbi:MAG: ferredoxin [Candidatus Omnitrophica bacterium]|nr:ferredoxin [Candidatus Omnitrophota bacterium]